MLRSFTLLRATHLSLLLSFAVMTAGCGDDTDEAAGSGTDSGSSDGSRPGTDAGHGDGSTGDGGDGGGGDGGVDTSAPTVQSVSPAPATMNAATNAVITAEFSESMAPGTLVSPSMTFGVVRTDSGAAVTGTVTYSDTTATFAPTTDLAVNTTYTATISTAATDVAGNPLGAAYTWTFKTDATAPLGPKPVLLGASGNYVILAKTAITNVPTSAVTGNVAISPAAGTYITGFDLTRAGSKWTSVQVTGSVFSADNDPPTPSNLTTAVSNMQTAYTDAAGRPSPTLDLGGGTIGGLVFAPGLYKWNSSVTIPTSITLSGGANDVWIFQVTGDLKMSSDQTMTMVGARPKNVFWQVAGFVELGTGAHAEGIVLSQTAITLATGASVNGRLLAQTAVTIGKSTITKP
ncbi:MAG: hypothetical protein JWP97_2811 [Labilithrix sp.]|nr:hypothetical protein [Labilithrix sp.]